MAHYTYGFGLISQVTASGSAYYYDFNLQGSTVGITNASGSYVNQCSYDPFGQVTTISAGIANPFTFVGEFGVSSDGNGLVYMRARYYDPSTGQFVSNDPLGLTAGQTNCRQYASDDPLTLIDASGLKCYRAKKAWAALPPLQLFPTGDTVTVKAKGFPKTPFPVYSADGTTKGPLYFPFGKDAYGTTWYKFTPYPGGGDDQNNDPGPNCPNPPPPPPPPCLGCMNGGGGGSNSLIPDDPNDLIGPSGYGSAGFIAPTGVLPYTIEFSNEKTAQVPADNVVVTEQLSPNLDWSTFQLGTIGFGSYVVNVPPGLTSYSTRVDATATLGVYVDVDASPNIRTGLLTVTFESLDPTTLDAPSNPLVGFLPPDTNPPNGEGYINYTIQPKAGLATGATLNAQVSIVFDTNAPLATPQITNTIDASPPASTVAALPATTTRTSFKVSWSGSDVAGPGIADYNVYVSDNGAAYTLWQADTTDTSATYTGQIGHTYRFYSVATDELGLVQPNPTSAQATTKIVAPPLVRVMRVQETTNKKHQVTAVEVTFSGAVNAAEADQIATYHLATPGKGGSYTAKNAGVIKLRSASYSPAGDTVTLSPAKPFAPSKPVELVVYGPGPNALQDTYGRDINGGKNAVAILSKTGAAIEAVEALRTSASTGLAPAAIDALLERGAWHGSGFRA